MAETYTTAPTRLTQGDTHTWTRSLSDYPATGGWTLTTYWVRTDGTTAVELEATPDGADHLYTINNAKAAEFAAVGTYLWREVAVSATETVTLARGRLELLDPLTGGSDLRLWLEKMLDAIEAKLQGRATAQQLSYSIENRSLSMMSLQEVLDARDRLKAELEGILAADARANGDAVTSRVRVRFWG